MMVLTFQVGRLLRTASQFGGTLLRFAHKKTGTLRENAQMQAGGFKPIPYPQTPQSAARWFKRNGVCKAHWAKYFNLERTTVEHLLRGKLKGNFGKSHEAAVKLGLKEQADD